MKARLFVCTTCDRYAGPPDGPTRGEAMLASVRAAAAAIGAGHLIHAVACVMSCPRPCGAALRDGRGGGMIRFAGLRPSDAPALVAFVAARAADATQGVPEVLSRRVASHIPPRP